MGKMLEEYALVHEEGADPDALIAMAQTSDNFILLSALARRGDLNEEIIRALLCNANMNDLQKGELLKALRANSVYEVFLQDTEIAQTVQAIAQKVQDVLE